MAVGDRQCFAMLCELLTGVLQVVYISKDLNQLKLNLEKCFKETRTKNNIFIVAMIGQF